MKKLLMSAVCFLMVLGWALGGIVPLKEERILRNVARNFQLTEHETHLLLVIRRIENGRPGLELGVGDGIPNHPARRHAGNFDKSLRLQAEWAAGTIKKRFEGDLVDFARRYCPLNWKVWSRNASRYMPGMRSQLVKNTLFRKSNVEFDGKNDEDTVNKRIPDSKMFNEKG